VSTLHVSLGKPAGVADPVQGTFTDAGNAMRCTVPSPRHHLLSKTSSLFPLLPFISCSFLLSLSPPLPSIFMLFSSSFPPPLLLFPLLLSPPLLFLLLPLFSPHPVDLCPSSMKQVLPALLARQLFCCYHTSAWGMSSSHILPRWHSWVLGLADLHLGSQRMFIAPEESRLS